MSQIKGFGFMNYIFVIFFSFFSYLNFAQSAGNELLTRNLINGIQINSENELNLIPKNYTGKVFQCTKNGIITYLINYNKGLKEGLATKWQLDINGDYIKEYEETFKKGKQHGTLKYWHNNGNLKREVHFLNGNQSGSDKSWYDNGKPLKEEYYRVFKNKEGKDIALKDGFCRSWSQNDGLLNRETLYFEGIIWLERIFQNGKLINEIKYKNNSKIEIKTWNEEGLLNFHQCLVNETLVNCPIDEKNVYVQPSCGEIDDFNGIREFQSAENNNPFFGLRLYDSIPEYYTGQIRMCNDEKIIQLISVTCGIPNGIEMVWFLNGQISKEKSWRYGYLVGKSKSYYPSGILQWEIDYENHIEKSYFDNSQLKSVIKNSRKFDFPIHFKMNGNGNYSYGHNESQEHYYQNGTLKEKIEFKDGKIMLHSCWDEKGHNIKCKW